MSKFKVGDKVRVVKLSYFDNGGYFNMLGKTSHIIEVCGVNKCKVRCVKHPEGYWYFSFDEIEHASEPSLEDQLKEAEAKVAELKERINFVDRYEAYIYVNKCSPPGILDVSLDWCLGMDKWNAIRTEICHTKYKITLEKIKEN